MSITATPPAIHSAITGDSPRARRADPVTSHDAADKTVRKAEASQAEVLRILNDFGPLPDFAIANRHAEHCRSIGWPEHIAAATGGPVDVDAVMFSTQRLRTARAELVQLGRVEDANEMVPVIRAGSSRKTYAVVWRITTTNPQEG